MKLCSSLALITLFTLGQFLFASDIPHLINYQGRITDKTGTPLQGDYSLQFALYETVENGSPLWSEVQSQVTISNGLFHVLLGSVAPLPPVLFRESPALYLEISVGGEKLSPRLQLTSVSFAFSSTFSDSTRVAATASSARPTGNASGDLSGVYPGPTVEKIQGKNIAGTSPSDGQVLKWNSGQSRWEPGTDLAGGAASTTVRISGDGTAGAPLDIAQQSATSGQSLVWNGSAWAPASITAAGSASGDLSGAYPSPTVAKIQGQNVATTTPGNGQVLKWNSGQTRWEPGTDLAGGAASTTVRISGDGTAGAPLDIAQQSATSGQSLVWNGSAWAPAAVTATGSANGDLSGNYPSPTVAKIQGQNVATTTPSNGQVLKWNSGQTRWEPGTDNTDDPVSVTARFTGTGESGSPLDLAQQSAATGQVLEWSGSSWAPGNKSSGDITGVTAGAGLSGGGASGSVTLDVGSGTGITVNTNDISLNTSYTDERYVNEGQSNAATHTMIVDEPGFKFAVFSNFTLANNTNNQAIGSVTITAPANGYVIASASGYVDVNHTNGTSDNIFVNVLTDESGTVQSDGTSGFAVPSTSPTYWLNRGTFASENMFPVSSGQALTIYLVIRQYNGANIGDTWVGHSRIKAIFYTTEY